MRLTLGSLLLLAATCTNAQYFSAGWAPGQPIANEPAAAESTIASTPAAEAVRPTETRITPLGLVKKLTKAADPAVILRSKPVASLFSLAGINITERINSVIEDSEIWDPRVPLITDENYRDLILNEEMTAEEQEKRTWFLIVSAFTLRQDAISRFSDETFDQVYNESLIANDLPHVRFGRIDYLNVTHLTTKWSIWNAPWLIVARDRGQTLRFYNIRNAKLPPKAIRDFLIEEQWRQTTPWSSSFGPGGSNEWIVEGYATALTFVYVHTEGLPRWMLYVISGAIGSFLINLLHSGSSGAPPPQPQRRVPAGESAPADAAAPKAKSTAVAAPATPAKTSKGKKKGGKK